MTRWNHCASAAGLWGGAKGGREMTWVIGPLCTDRMDTACVEVCPVDCIHRYLGDDPDIPQHQLLIDPEVCIDCGVCEPACPWEAIYQDTAVPEAFQPAIEIPDEDKPQPTAEEVVENREKWRQQLR